MTKMVVLTMRRTHIAIVAALCSPIFAAQTASATYVPGINFKGKNICLGLEKPSITGVDYTSMRGPVVRMTTELNVQTAEYEIRLAEMGAVSLHEELEGSTAVCDALPLNTFHWHDGPDGKTASAEFCLTAPKSSDRVHVQASARTDTVPLADIKRVLFGIAVCRMRYGPGLGHHDESFTQEDVLQIGPYVPGWTPSK